MKDEETIVIDTDIRYKKIIVRNITNFHAVKNTPKIIRVERQYRIIMMPLHQVIHLQSIKQRPHLIMCNLL